MGILERGKRVKLVEVKRTGAMRKVLYQPHRDAYCPSHDETHLIGDVSHAIDHLVRYRARGTVGVGGVGVTVGMVGERYRGSRRDMSYGGKFHYSVCEMVLY